MAAISGFGGRVRIGGVAGTVLPAGHWTLNYKANTTDTSTFEHSIAHDYVLSGVEFEITIDCFWDTTLDPFAVANNLNPGGVFQSFFAQDATATVELELYLCAGDENRVWRFYEFLVESVVMDDSNRSVVKYTLSGRNVLKLDFSETDIDPDTGITEINIFGPSPGLSQRPEGGSDVAPGPIEISGD